MAVSYSNLFVLLIDKKMKEENLCAQARVRPSTIRKMGCGKTAAMNTDTQPQTTTSTNVSGSGGKRSFLIPASTTRWSTTERPLGLL